MTIWSIGSLGGGCWGAGGSRGEQLSPGSEDVAARDESDRGEEGQISLESVSVLALWG